MTAISESLTPLNWMSSGRAGRSHLTLLRVPRQPTAPENPFEMQEGAVVDDVDPSLGG